MIGELFKEAFVEAGGVRTRYVEAGTGDPVILLHGDGGLQRSPAHELLAQRFRVIALELPQGRGSATAEDLGRSMNAAVAALGIERYRVIGTSFGSTVALWMAILRPEAVEALVLSGPDALAAHDAPLEKRVEELPLPVLVLFGTLDEITPPENARRYREIMQNCHIILVYNAAHAIDADRPEAFASLAGDFLSRKEQFVVRDTSALIHP